MVNRNEIREELNRLGVASVSEILNMSKQSPRVRGLMTPGPFRQIFYPEEILIVESWLEEQGLKEKQLSRDQELAIAKESNEITKKANQISWWAIVISAISLIASVFALWWK